MALLDVEFPTGDRQNLMMYIPTITPSGVVDIEVTGLHASLMYQIPLPYVHAEVYYLS